MGHHDQLCGRPTPILCDLAREASRVAPSPMSGMEPAPPNRTAAASGLAASRWLHTICISHPGGGGGAAAGCVDWGGSQGATDQRVAFLAELYGES
jgi:hypothetical protein